MAGIKQKIDALYEGESDGAQTFRYALLAFDLITIAFVVATSFTERGMFILGVDLFFGAIILVDFAARLWIARRKVRFLFSLGTLADLASIVSFLAPLAGESFGFLRVLRTLRLLRTYALLERLRKDVPLFKAHEDVVLATVNLGVFIFVMTGLVYATQYDVNPKIDNWGDAAYFTVAALTTTGFGDITLTGTLGRMISVVVMIFGVTLFLRLAQVLFRARKVRQECSHCGLKLHEADAVHCKHCGEVIHIETEGES